MCKIIKLLLHCRIESGAEASSSNSYSAAAIAAPHPQMYAPYEQLGRNNNQTSCICGRTDVSDTTVQCEVIHTTAPIYTVALGYNHSFGYPKMCVYSEVLLYAV